MHYDKDIANVQKTDISRPLSLFFGLRGSSCRRTLGDTIAHVLAFEVTNVGDRFFIGAGSAFEFHRAFV